MKPLHINSRGTIQVIMAKSELAGLEELQAAVADRIQTLRSIVSDGHGSVLLPVSGGKTSSPAAPTTTKRIVGEEARRRIAAAQKKRWETHRQALAKQAREEQLRREDQARRTAPARTPRKRAVVSAAAAGSRSLNSTPVPEGINFDELTSTE